ncbi:MAG: 16S rRNA (guanine(527)-N(7))-methyltransferase RsmG [Bacteroidetes bacterium]|nr:16S rRNA (guanine(527)-N(7))-methyltransferase RsmG [Bacteroidota bacterium]MBS1929482.1 16S rRNA (guanine(527)-N(7))-methyltransferase RsmG [Bacteroidota bacterium]
MEKTPQKLELITKYFSDFTNRQLEQLAALESVYREWNNKINVISRKDIDSLYEKHILHSLSIAVIFDSKTIGFEKNSEIIDIGTGGGFPGIPLAIFFPEVKFHLVDSIGKKLKVVQAVVENLGLENVTVQHTRAEEIKDRKFDFAVSRAVASIKELWVWSKPLLKKQEPKLKFPRGLICLKGGDLAREIQESSTQPRIMEIAELFSEPYFKEKFILHIPR